MIKIVNKLRAAALWTKALSTAANGNAKEVVRLVDAIEQLSQRQLPETAILKAAALFELGRFVQER